MNGVDWGSLATAIVALIGAVTAHYRITTNKPTKPKA